MESFKKITQTILSITINANEFNDNRYFFITSPIIDDAYNGESDLLRLQIDAVTDLLTIDAESAERQLKRLKRIVQELYDLLENETYNHSNDHLFQQITLTAALRGFIFKREYDYKKDKYPVHSDNFIVELENELDARLHLIQMMEEGAFLTDPQPVSIYPDGEVLVSSKKYELSENELPWSEWSEITKRKLSPRVIKEKKNFKKYEDLFVREYRDHVESFNQILSKGFETELGYRMEGLINGNNEWRGSGKLAYIFYGCLFDNGIVHSANVATITNVFLDKFTGLSKSFTTGGRKTVNNQEEDYQKYFNESILETKKDILKH